MSTSQEELEAIAAELHESWRAKRIRKDGTYEPRFKPDDEGQVIDIASLTFAALPSRWKEENVAAARSAEQAVISSVTLEEAAERVHEEWLARNFDIAEDEQRGEYQSMPEEEKAKDRRVALIAARLTRRPLADPTAERKKMKS